MYPIQLGELLSGFPFAIEELDDGHTADVFLKEAINPRDSGSDSPIGLANAIPEEICENDHERKRRKCGQSENRIPPEQKYRQAKELHKIVEHGDNTRGEQVVQGVHICGRTRYKPPDRAAVEKAHGQSLQVLENFLAEVVHRFLSDRLHDSHLSVLQAEVCE